MLIGEKRVVIFFEKTIGFKCLKILADSLGKVGLTAVSTAKNREVFPEIDAFCRASNIAFMVEDKPNNPEFLEKIRNIKPELAFAVSYSKIFKEGIIGLFPKGIVNFHPALLPRQGGCFPTMWSIIEGDKVAGYTMHKIDTGIDTGAILAQIEVPIAADDTGESLYAKQIKAGEKLFKDNWFQALNGQIEARPQPGGGCYHKKELPFGGYVPWDKDLAFIKRTIRAFSNSAFPGILAKTDSGVIEVLGVEPTDEVEIETIGELVHKDAKFFGRCADAVVRISYRTPKPVS